MGGRLTMAKIKRLFNDPYDIVEEMVEGYVGAHKQYVKMCDLDEAQGRVVLANDAGTKDKVGVIIGGGSDMSHYSSVMWEKISQMLL